MKSGELAGREVARYLRPEAEVVPFQPRPELAELLNWCTTGGHLSVRLLVGVGGTGKTRLALRLGQELSANGWRVSWVWRGHESEAVALVRDLGQPSLLLVDYAETRDSLGRLLADVAASTDGPDLRVLLLARGTGEWWQHLVANSDEAVARLLTVPPVTLGTISIEGGAGQGFR
jgi:hypothetical protein